MTVLRSALLLLFACYCSATNEDCRDICHDPWVSMNTHYTLFIAHFYCVCIIWFVLRTKNFEVIPGNVKCLASHISSSAIIKDNVIFLSNLISGDVLLEVPIETPDTTIITLSINSSYPNTHHSKVLLGVTDQMYDNWFQIVDAAQCDESPPCQPLGPVADNPLVSEGTKVPPIFKLSVHPKGKFGYCQTAQEGGYINCGIFQQQLLLLYSLVFKLTAWETEEYSIHSLHSYPIHLCNLKMFGLFAPATSCSGSLVSGPF